MLASKYKIGDFDRTITFQEKVIVDNDFNEDEEQGWQNITTDPTVPAKKEESGIARLGDERYEADKLTEIRTTIFTVRYRTDVSEINRFYDDDGLIYDIVSINETVRRRFLEIKGKTKQEYIEFGGAFSEGFTPGFEIQL